LIQGAAKLGRPHLLVTTCATRTDSTTKPEQKTQPTPQNHEEVVHPKTRYNNNKQKTTTHKPKKKTE
jgi:hypothetical protein